MPEAPPVTLADFVDDLLVGGGALTDDQLVALLRHRAGVCHSCGGTGRVTVTQRCFCMPSVRAQHPDGCESCGERQGSCWDCDGTGV